MKRLLLVVAVLIGGWYWLMWSHRMESDAIPAEHGEASALMAAAFADGGRKRSDGRAADSGGRRSEGVRGR